MDQSQTLFELNEKIDALTAQLGVLTEYVEEQRRRQRELDDLKADLTPIAMEAYQVAVEQFSELEPYVQLEDLLYLVKRSLATRATSRWCWIRSRVSPIW